MICSNCGSSVARGDKFCTSCGTSVSPSGQTDQRAATPSVASTVAKTFTRRARRVYAVLTVVLLGLFLYIFILHLPGNAHPVIEKQPDVAMASTFIGVKLSAQPVDVQVKNGKVSFPLVQLLEKRMIQFEYATGSTSLPVMAYISPEGKLVTAIRMCEPCNSHSFTIDADEMVCGVCGTRWKLKNLEGVQGSCQKYPPDPIPSEIVGNEVQIDEAVLKNWKMRI